MTNPSFIDDISHCAACPFASAEHKPLAPVVIPVPVPIMFIGENPSWQEGQVIPFDPCTPSGQALDAQYLKPLGMTRQDVWITDLFKCRYPKAIYYAKTANADKIQGVAATCVTKWLFEELSYAKPKVIVTLSDKEVYQRLRKVLRLDIPAKFATAIGTPISIAVAGHTAILFPMVHPDISRISDTSSKFKRDVQERWAPLHASLHIPTLKSLLKN